ncbi:hypothetical protein CTheo_3338 [Ceratobasidium theobromae]|uniref:VTT domain-containing protein n=1 Tax=Ceratobasidium theobromae TaxID=1582974 RepID=A0A5N5QQ28_9AGAM|nr:hypothetical protein CTheo_3338 [Ceratobasidium theobromae]
MSLSPPQPLRARASSIVQPLTIDSLRRTTGLATPPASPFSSVFTRPPRQHLPSPALSRTPSPPPRETHAPVLRLAAGFALSAVPILMALSTLPVALRMPRTLADIALLGRDLKAYAASAPGMAHVMAVMCCLAVWEHAWSIPGSVVLNVLAGALVSPLWATLLMTLLTSLGSLAASLLAAPLEPIVQRIAPKALDVVASALQGDPRAAKRTPTWVRIVVMRLVGVVPWSAINIACGVCRVPFVDCAIGAFIGALPWTAVTCQTLALGSSSDPKTLSSLLSSPAIILKLVLLSLLSLGPVLCRDKLTDALAATDEKAPLAPAPMWKVWHWRRSSHGLPRPKSPERTMEEVLDENLIFAMSPHANHVMYPVLLFCSGGIQSSSLVYNYLIQFGLGRLEPGPLGIPRSTHPNTGRHPAYALSQFSFQHPPVRPHLARRSHFDVTRTTWLAYKFASKGPHIFLCPASAPRVSRPSLR